MSDLFFKRTKESVANYTHDDGFTGLVEVVVFERSQQDLIGYATEVRSSASGSVRLGQAELARSRTDSVPVSSEQSRVEIGSCAAKYCSCKVRQRVRILSKQSCMRAQTSQRTQLFRTAGSTAATRTGRARPRCACRLDMRASTLYTGTAYCKCCCQLTRLWPHRSDALFPRQ